MCPRRELLLLVFVGIACGSCSYPIWKRSYKGEGTFTDFGTTAGADRYVLNLGKIGFSNRKTYPYDIGSLPKEKFIVGFEILTSEFRGERPYVRLKLEDRKKRATVFDVEGEIYDGRGNPEGWVYSGRAGSDLRFVWKKEDSDIPLTETQRKSGHAGGSTFVPKRWHTYSLECSVIEPISSEYAGYLTIKGGGWK